MARILICDDEKDIAKSLEIYLSAEGYETRVAFNGREALDIIGEERIDLVLLDIMMPVMDGIETLREIRRSYDMPVIFLSAKSEDQDKILGLNLGADDYVTKPFNMVETAARVRSNLRRYALQGSMQEKDEIIIGGISINDREKKVKVDGEEADLTPKEYAILRLLMSSPGKVFSLREIYREVWGEDPVGSESTVSVHVRHLREKTEVNPAEPRYIKAVWGQGYKFEGGKL
ncbi:MAG: response regulator transcription factor [Clostridiales bacterium]|nr:response regulator transcription factor [Clostridiales bacterium]MDD7036256.1 response regulator transcription factor [Bacillota bacterium]MDY2921134.1 response regulator transcription factor [Lentihominibacter sp.]